MNFKSALKSFLTNKWVLNIVALIALLNVIGYLTIGNFDAVVYFIIIAVLTRFFSKNMIIVLGVPVLLVGFLLSRNVISEGMENNNDKNTTSNPNSTSNSDKKNKPKKENMDNLESKNKNNKQDQKTNQGLPITPIYDDLDTTTDTSSSTATTGEESFEVGRGKRRTGAQIDYAATVEDAYDELNKILGSDGVKRLTDDTQRLMKQQMQLAESMKSMTPVIQGMAPMLQTAKELMKGMGDNKQDLGSVLKLAEQFKQQ